MMDEDIAVIQLVKILTILARELRHKDKFYVDGRLEEVEAWVREMESDNDDN